jgi:hypothetical protein
MSLSNDIEKAVRESIIEAYKKAKSISGGMDFLIPSNFQICCTEMLHMGVRKGFIYNYNINYNNGIATVEYKESAVKSIKSITLNPAKEIRDNNINTVLDE